MSETFEDPLAEVAFRFSAARVWAVHRAPYLASALYLLRSRVVEPRVDERTGAIEPDERFSAFPTGTDWSVHLDPGTVLQTGPPVIGWWLLHHVGHLVRGHARRSPGQGSTLASGATGLRDPDAVLWNMAADAEVNDDLDGERFGCPPDVLTPDRWGLPRGLVAEDYLARIDVLPDRVRRSAGVDCGSCADGTPREWDAVDLDGAEADAPSELDRELLSRSSRGDILKRMARRSDMPGGWVRWAEHSGTATVDWRRVLRSVLSKNAASKLGAIDFAYGRPSRRGAAFGDIVIPAMVKPSPSPALLVDTSCSIGATRLVDLVAEVDALVRLLSRSHGAVPVVCCDVAASPVQRLRDPRGLVLHGGGGTDLRVGFDALVRVRPRPDLVVVVTDGDTPWPERRPRGTRVVVLLVDGPREVPAWATAVVRQDDVPAVIR